MFSQASIKKRVKKIYFFLFSVMLFFIPLIFVNNTGELYEFPKTFFIYIFAGLIITIFLLNLVFYSGEILLPELPVVLLLIACILSTLLSQYKYTSFWGYYTRFNGGLLSLLSYFVIYIVARNVFGKKDLWQIIKFSVVSSLIVSTYGIIQHFSGISRVYSTIGQPNWVAHFYVMILPIAIQVYLQSKKRFNIWYFAYLLGYLCLWFTYSLSGMISFFVGFIILKCIYGRFTKFEEKMRFFLIIAPIFLIAIIFPGMFYNKISDAIYDLRSIVAVKKAYAMNSEYIVSDPGSIRFGLWKGTINLIFSSPLVFTFGSGLETFPYAFQEFRPKILNYSSEWEYVFNKPHNYYPQLWAEIGILGLLAFLYLQVYILRCIPKYFIPSLVAFMVANFFGWPTVCPSLLFWLLISTSKNDKS